MYYQSEDNSFRLYLGDSMEVLRQLQQQVDVIFADPPYFLSGGRAVLSTISILLKSVSKKLVFR